MDPELDDKQVSTSSAETEVKDAVPSSPIETVGETETTADSSAAKGEDDASLLKVVRDAVKPKAATSDPASPAGGGEDKGQSKGKTPDDEAFTDVPFHKHPRFQQLLRQRDVFKAGAQQFENVQRFMEVNGLDAQEAADAMIVASLLKRDPVEAWNRLKPVVQNLLTVIGEVLPDDLKQRVQKGELSRDAAFELSRARARSGVLEQRQQYDAGIAERRAAAEAVAAQRHAATEWEQQRYAKDPNFATKVDDLRKEVLWLQHSEGVPNTPDGVRTQLEKAYKAVNERLRPVGGVPAAKTEVKPVTGGQVSPAVVPKPQSVLDVVRTVGRKAAQ